MGARLQESGANAFLDVYSGVWEEGLQSVCAGGVDPDKHALRARARGGKGVRGRRSGRTWPCRWMWEEVAPVRRPLSTRSSTPSSAMSSQRHSSSTACACGSARPSAAQTGGVSRGFVDEVTVTAEASEVNCGTRRCQCMPDTAKVRRPGLPLSKACFFTASLTLPVTPALPAMALPPCRPRYKPRPPDLKPLPYP